MTRRLLAVLIVAAACSTGGSGSAEPGTLALTLTSAGNNDGAIVVLVSGGPVLSVDAPAGYQIASNTDAAGTHVMIVGQLTAGAVATVKVPDVSRAAGYVVTVEQVADRTSFALLDPARDLVAVSRAP